MITYVHAWHPVNGYPKDHDRGASVDPLLQVIEMIQENELIDVVGQASATKLEPEPSASEAHFTLLQNPSTQSWNPFEG
jgi:hypothetical protein